MEPTAQNFGDPVGRRLNWSGQGEEIRGDHALSRKEIEALFKHAAERTVFERSIRDEIGFGVTIPADFAYAANATGGTRFAAIGPGGRQTIMVSRRHGRGEMDELKTSVRNEFARTWTHLAISQEKAGSGFYGETLTFLVEGTQDTGRTSVWIGIFRRVDQVFVIAVNPGSGGAQAAGKIVESFRVE